MGRRSHGIAFGRRVVHVYLSDETPHGLAARHDPVRVRVRDHGVGTLDDATAAYAIQDGGARSAALGRLVGRWAPEFVSQKEPPRSTPGTGSEPRSGITGTAVSPLDRDARWLAS